MCGIEDRAARGLVHAAALHADQTVLHDVQQADAIGAADLIQLVNDLLRAHFLPVERHRHALFKVQGHIGRAVRRLNRRDAHLKEAGLFILRLVAGVLQIQTLVRKVPEVLVLGIVGLAVDLQRHMMRFGIVDLLIARLDAPLAPGGDDRHVRRKVLDGQFKTHLVIALAGAAVDDRVRAFLQCDLYQSLGDAGTRMARAQQIVFIYRAGLHAGDDEVVDILVRQIQHIEFRRAGLQCFFFQAFQFVRLSDIAGNCDDFAVVVVLLQPGDDDRGVETAGIGKNNFFDISFIHIYTLLIGYLCGDYKPFRRSSQRQKP